MSTKTSKQKTKSIEERFQKKTQREHILIRPDTYIGKITPETEEMWIFDKNINLIIKKNITYVPGFYKIIDELIVNARDHYTREPTCTWIRMYFNQEDGSITIWNNGPGIPVEFHKDENVYVPELLLGHLLTGENFDDNDKRITGGRNGLGAKCISYDTKVPLFDGTIKLAKEIVITDKLIGDDGNVRNIKSILHSSGKMYEISQQFGKSYKVNENHTLTLFMPSHKVIFWNNTENSWNVNWWDFDKCIVNSKSIKITKKISNVLRKHIEKTNALKQLETFCKNIPNSNVIDINIQDYLKLDNFAKSKLEGFKGSCVKWQHSDVLIDPYILGLWLGKDFTCLEKNIDTYEMLKSYNLLNNKHVPQDYIINSTDIRLKLLAGFIDAKGKISRQSKSVIMTYDANNKKLLDNITFLVESLGLRCNLIEKSSLCFINNTKQLTKYYTMTISGNIKKIPARLLFGINDKVNSYNNTTGIISVREISNDNYVGFEIDGNNRFVINDFTVTHNCANIFGNKFIVETVDTVSKKKYRQEWTENMSNKTDPLITNIKKGDESYTKIICFPDYARFKMKGLDDDHMSLLMKRAYDISACTGETVKVYLNDELIKVKKFTDYIKMYYKESPELIYEECDRWKVGVVYERDVGNQQVSFVNGVWTYQGGTHLKYIEDQIYDKLTATIKKKYKITVKRNQIREHLTFFIDSIIDNPSFTGQTKGELGTKVAEFGSTCTISPGFLTKLEKTGIVSVVGEYANFKEESKLKSSDGSKRASVRDIPKLDDADWAGTLKGKYCRLILTEGDSAKAFALAGLKKIGREQFGVFPLKGKPLNFRKAPYSQIKKNEEFGYLKRILGLKQDKVYTDVKDLRYGGIIILTDQDVDGSHIKGLIINMLQCYWPELLKIDGFIQTMSTPIIKAFKKSDKKKKDGLSFYTISDYEKWVSEVLHHDTSKYNIKYYKGLGTSDDKEAREIFNEFEQRIVSFIWETSQETSKNVSNTKLIGKESENSNNDDQENNSNDADKDTKSDRLTNKKEKLKRINRSFADPEIYKSPSFNSITLMFDEGREDDRKDILRNYNKNLVLEYDKQNVTYSDFFLKDMIHFSHEDNERSIPSVVDGMKPSQRKILYASFKKNQTSEIKVAQLAAYVSEHTAYKHGEVSLQEAIIGMAQIYPGSNNICVLHPSGNHGHRNLGGKDHASPRYIFTNIEPLTFYIFRKEDEVILNHVIDEGSVVEPEFYYPVIPMVLANGGSGVGTGYSSSVLQYNPKDLVMNLNRRIDNKQMIKMNPWYNGFTGTITEIKENEYLVMGKFELVEGNDNAVRVTEIPIKRKQYCWIDDYYHFLKTLESEDKKDNKIVLKVHPNKGGNDEVDFLIEFKPNEFQKLYKKGEDEIIKFLKLSTIMTSSNLHMYDHHHTIIKYEDPLEILEQFFEIRLEAYERRRAIHLQVLLNELEILKYKVKFIEDYRSKKIVIQDRSEAVIEEDLQKRKYPKLSTHYNAPENEKSYSYLTNMRLWSLSQERINELNKEYNTKKSEYEDYLATSALELWRRELNQFDTEYDKWLVDMKDYLNDNEEDEDGKPKKKQKTKSTTNVEKKPTKKVNTEKKPTKKVVVK